MSKPDPSSTRGLPRAFVPGAPHDVEFELPKEEVKKFRQVLRLNSGATIAILPNDGTLLVCRLDGHRAVPISVERPETEPLCHVTILQALPKGDKLDEVARSCSSIGVNKFVFFPSERSVVRWDTKKLEDRLERVRTICRESCELSYRTRLPEVEYVDSLKVALAKYPEAIVLSEVESEKTTFSQRVTGKDEIALAIGPEGGWAPRELELIGDRGVTLGPRVLRTEHAAFAAASKILIP